MGRTLPRTLTRAVRRNAPGSQLRLLNGADLVGRYQSAIDTRPGVGERTAETSISCYFNGATVITLDSPVIIPAGEFTMRFSVRWNGVNHCRILGTSDASWSGISIKNNDRIVVSNGTNFPEALLNTPLVTGTIIHVEIKRGADGVMQYAKVNGVTQQAFSIPTTGGLSFPLIGKLATSFTNAYVWDIHVENPNGIIFSDTLAAGAGSRTNPAVGPVGTISGYTGTPWHEDITFGYDWNKVPHFEGENLVIYSQDFLIAVAWTTYQANKVLSSEVTPYGVTAAKIIATADAGTHLINNTPTPTLTVGQAYTVSAVVKAAEYTSVELRLNADNSTKATFSLTSETVVSSSGITEGFVVALGGGWYRVGFSFTAAFATTDTRVALVQGSDTKSFTGDGVSGIYLGQVQLNVGTEVTDYVKTEAYQYQGKSPDVPTNPGYNAAGSPLNMLGKARNSLDVYGYTVDFDGATYGETSPWSECSTVAGALEVDFIAPAINAAALMPISSGAGSPYRCYLAVNANDNRLFAGFGTLANTQIGTTVLTPGNRYLAKLVWTSTTVSVHLSVWGDNEFNEYTLEYTGARSGDPVFNVNGNIGKFQGTFGLFTSPIYRGTIYGPSDEILYDWILEDRKDSTSPRVYDRVGGNHATLAGYTGSPWTVRKAGSVLLEKGFTDGLTNRVELWNYAASGVMPNITKSNGAYVVTTGSTDITNNRTFYPGPIGSKTVIQEIEVLVACEIRTYNGTAFDLYNGGVPLDPGFYSITCKNRSSDGVNMIALMTTGGIVKINSVQEKNSGLVPASLTNTLVDVYGNSLTQLPGKITPDSPVEFEGPDSQEVFLSDTESQLGPERVTNGTFDSDITGWSAPAGAWSWVDGKAKLDGDGSVQLFLQYGVCTIGKKYRVSFDLGMTSGQIILQNQAGTTVAGGVTGSYSTEWVADTTALSFKRLLAAGVAVGTLDNVSVREVLDPINFLYEPDGDKRVIPAAELLPEYGPELIVNGTFDTNTVWSKDAGWTIANGVATFAPNAGRNIVQTFTAEAGHKYEVMFDIVSIGGSATGIGAYVTESEEGPIAFYETSLGTHVYTFTALGGTAYLKLRAADTTMAGSIDNVQMRDITNTGATQNNQNFFGQKGLALYKEPRSDATAVKMLSYIQPYGD